VPESKENGKSTKINKLGRIYINWFINNSFARQENLLVNLGILPSGSISSNDPLIEVNVLKILLFWAASVSNFIYHMTGILDIYIANIDTEVCALLQSGELDKNVLRFSIYIVLWFS
ncbi:hypothetical protein ACJX0J_006991, partial [Zea mays]